MIRRLVAATAVSLAILPSGQAHALRVVAGDGGWAVAGQDSAQLTGEAVRGYLLHDNKVEVLDYEFENWFESVPLAPASKPPINDVEASALRNDEVLVAAGSGLYRVRCQREPRPVELLAPSDPSPLTAIAVDRDKVAGLRADGTLTAWRYSRGAGGKDSLIELARVPATAGIPAPAPGLRATDVAFGVQNRLWLSLRAGKTAFARTLALSGATINFAIPSPKPRAGVVTNGALLALGERGGQGMTRLDASPVRLLSAGGAGRSSALLSPVDGKALRPRNVAGETVAVSVARHDGREQGLLVGPKGRDYRWLNPEASGKAGKAAPIEGEFFKFRFRLDKPDPVDSVRELATQKAPTPKPGKRRETNGKKFGGTAGQDRIDGTSGVDRIQTGAGKDYIDGKGSSDTIIGGGGGDRIIGGDGGDRISAGSEPDIVASDRGDGSGSGSTADIVTDAGENADTIFAGPGGDKVDGGLSDDWVIAGPGDDRVTDTAGGLDYVDGGADNDVISTDAADDVVLGGGGSDTIRTGRAQDVIDSGTSSSAPEKIYAGTAADYVQIKDATARVELYTEQGADVVFLGRNRKFRIDCGGAKDVFIYEPVTTGEVPDLDDDPGDPAIFTNGCAGSPLLTDPAAMGLMQWVEAFKLGVKEIRPNGPVKLPIKLVDRRQTLVRSPATGSTQDAVDERGAICDRRQGKTSNQEPKISGLSLANGYVDPPKAYGPFDKDPRPPIYLKAVIGSDLPEQLRGGEGPAGTAYPRNPDEATSGGRDYVDGRGGSDYVDGEFGDDHLYGGQGEDVVLGRRGNDLMFGDLDPELPRIGPAPSAAGSGDCMRGGDGRDTIDGQEGEDYIVGDAGRDTLKGGVGDDFFDAITVGPRGSASEKDTVKCGLGKDTVTANLKSDDVDRYGKDTCEVVGYEGRVGEPRRERQRVRGRKALVALARMSR